MKIEELREMIRGVVGPMVEDAVAPLRARDDSLVERIIAGTQPKPPAEKGISAAKFVRALAAGRGDPERAARWAKGVFGENDFVTKALSASDATAGGVLVPPEMSAEVIELLRPRSVVRSLNPSIIPMDTGTMTMPKATGGASASYIGENQNIPKTEGTFGEITFNWKKLAALVPISNDLLRFNRSGVDALVRDDMVAALAERQDLAFIRNDGLSGTPKGLRYWAPAANVIPVNGTVNLANVTVDLGKAVLALEEGLSRLIRPGWMLHPRVAMFLMNIRDGNGNFAFRDEMRGGKLFDFPFRRTTQIPRTLGAGDESEIYLADFADVIIGESEQIMIDLSTEASYIDENNNLVSAFSKDQTVIRAIALHDLGVRHEESVAVLTAVDWA